MSGSSESQESSMMTAATPLEVAGSFGFSKLGEFAERLGTLSEPERDAILGLLEE